MHFISTSANKDGQDFLCYNNNIFSILSHNSFVYLWNGPFGQSKNRLYGMICVLDVDVYNVGRAIVIAISGVNAPSRPKIRPVSQ